jgi:hypothetical protein
VTITNLLTVVAAEFGWPMWNRGYEIMTACGWRDPAYRAEHELRSGWGLPHYNPAYGSPEWYATVSQIIDAIAGERQIPPLERDALLAAMLVGDDTPALRELLRRTHEFVTNRDASPAQPGDDA